MPTTHQPIIRKAYDERAATLSALGYIGYADYLNSDDWKKIRSDTLSFSPNCVVCQNTAVNVHHLRYDAATLLGLRSHMLIALCRTCHKQIEFWDKNKTSLGDANRILFKMLMRSRAPESKLWMAKYNEQKRAEIESGFRATIRRQQKEILVGPSAPRDIQARNSDFARRRKLGKLTKSTCTKL